MFWPLPKACRASPGSKWRFRSSRRYCPLAKSRILSQLFARYVGLFMPFDDPWVGGVKHRFVQR